MDVCEECGFDFDGVEADEIAERTQCMRSSTISATLPRMHGSWSTNSAPTQPSRQPCARLAR